MLADYRLVFPAVSRGFYSCSFVQPQPWNSVSCRLRAIDVESKTQVGGTVGEEVVTTDVFFGGLHNRRGNVTRCCTECLPCDRSCIWVCVRHLHSISLMFPSGNRQYHSSDSQSYAVLSPVSHVQHSAYRYCRKGRSAETLKLFGCAEARTPHYCMCIEGTGERRACFDSWR